MHKKSSAFTLIETIIVIGILSILLLLLINFYIDYNKSFSYVQATVTVANSAGAIMMQTSNTIRPASQIVASHLFSGTTYTSTSTSLVVELPSIDNTGNIIVGRYDYVAFYASGTIAYMLTQADNASTRTSSLKQLSDCIQSLTFLYDNVNFTLVKEVDTDVQTEKIVRGQTVQSHLHEQIYLRNKA